MENTVFKERGYSDFLLGKPKNAFAVLSGTVPELGYINVELDRVRAGMADFIVRVSSVKDQKKPRVVSIRGGRGLAKYETVKKLCSTVQDQMAKAGDATINWPNLDVEHMADMLFSTLKFYALNTNIETLRFSTEALAELHKQKEKTE
jgi:hypothetical protein